MTIRDFARLDGFDINFILEEFMGTKSRNERTEALVRSIYKAIDSGDARQAREYISGLKTLTNENNEDVIMAEMLMKRKGMRN